jgi:phosphate acetyltransferase
MPGIYIMSSEPQSGKTIAVLGIMEALAGRVHRVAVFRPLVREGDVQDRLINLVSTRYSIHGGYEDMYGTTYARARELLTTGKQEDLYREILERFRNLEEISDIVVCVGTDYRSVSVALEFDFNKVSEIQQEGSAIKILVVATDEELEMARQTVGTINAER